MKACVLEKPYDVRIKELPIPEPKDDEVLLRVTVAGICTNDVRDYKGSRYTYPRIGGHEYAGVIEKLGKDVDNGIFHIGQKVVNYIIDECGVCYNCKHEHENICDSAESGKTFYNEGGISGYFGFAEYIAVKARHLHTVPNDTPDAVSYTHLDVYKRQLQALMMKGNWGICVLKKQWKSLRKQIWQFWYSVTWIFPGK